MLNEFSKACRIQFYKYWFRYAAGGITPDLPDKPLNGEEAFILDCVDRYMDKNKTQSLTPEKYVEGLVCPDHIKSEILEHLKLVALIRRSVKPHFAL